MSRSESHDNLVREVMRALAHRFPNVSITADLQQEPGDEIPPVIDGFRPDVYAGKLEEVFIVIAEAKTDNDIDNRHTRDQVTSFINHLDRKKKGLFVLAVNGHKSDLAKTVLRFVRMEIGGVRTEIEIFDGCDFWRLRSEGGTSWDLI